MYSLYVYDPALIRVGIVESITSLQWLDYYQDAGEVKLVCAATAQNLALLHDGYRLYNTEETTAAVIVNTLLEDDGTAPKLTVRALLSVALLDRRVVMGTVQVSNVETAMRFMIQQNSRGLAIAPGESAGLTAQLNTQISWGSVLEAEKTLAKASGLGFRVLFDPASAAETFEVYTGTDRTAGNGYNGYFGDDIGNLSSVKLETGSEDYCNIAVVAGAGEGNARKVLFTGSAGEEERRELYVDARDIEQVYQTASDTGEIDENGNPVIEYTETSYTEAEYSAKLEARGIEKLSEVPRVHSVSAQVEQGSMQYRHDYWLGDIVPLKLSAYGIRIRARVSGIKIIYEGTGKQVITMLSEVQEEQI